MVGGFVHHRVGCGVAQFLSACYKISAKNALFPHVG